MTSPVAWCMDSPFLSFNVVRGSGLDQPGDGLAGLPDLHVRRLPTLADRLADTVLEVLVEQRQRHRLQGPRRSRDLGQHIDAVLIVLDHPLQPADLALDPPQPPQMIGLALAVPAHPTSHRSTLTNQDTPTGYQCHEIS